MEWTVLSKAGIIDKDIDLHARGLCSLKDFRGCEGLSKIGGNDVRHYAVFSLDLCLGGIKTFCIAGDQHEIMFMPSENIRQCESDTT